MSSRALRSAAIAVVIVVMAATTAAAQAIKIAWDPSTDPRVVGYKVFVGTAPDAPTSSVDTGNAESFVFAPAKHGVTYYFSVASYGTDGVVGPRSAEIIGVASNGRTASVWSSSPAGTTILPARVCFDDGRCYAPTAVVTGGGAITSVAASADGRIFYVEDSRFVKVVSADGGRATTVLDSGGNDAHVVSLAIDPSFATNGRVFTGELAPSRSGTELLIAKYRDVHDEFGERAIIASALPATDTVAPLTVDTAGHVFLALPTPPDGAPRSPYDGMVLRMNSDGTVPRDNPSGSPVFTRGYDVPTSLVDDPTNGILLTAGYSGAAPTSVHSAATGEAAIVSADALVLLGRDGALLRATPQSDGSYRLSTLDLGEFGTETSVAAHNDQIVVAIVGPDGQGSIVRLDPVTVETR